MLAFHNAWTNSIKSTTAAPSRSLSLSLSLSPTLFSAACCLVLCVPQTGDKIKVNKQALTSLACSLPFPMTIIIGHSLLCLCVSIQLSSLCPPAPFVSVRVCVYVCPNKPQKPQWRHESHTRNSQPLGPLSDNGHINVSPVWQCGLEWQLPLRYAPKHATCCHAPFLLPPAPTLSLMRPLYALLAVKDIQTDRQSHNFQCKSLPFVAHKSRQQFLHYSVGGEMGNESS